MNDFIIKYKNIGVEFEVENNSLNIIADKGILTKEKIEEIKFYKQEVIDYINSISKDYEEYYQIEKVALQESYPLSSAQRRLWILSQFEDGNLAYNMPGVYEFEGDLDIDSFQKAFDTLIERHEILRTVFKKDASGEVRQWIKTAEEQGFEIDYQDLRKIKNQKSRIKILIQTAIETAFDLEQGPLLKVQLLQTAKGKYTFIYVMHHIISDGWSMGVLVKELLTLYNNYSQGKPNPLEALTIQYKDYSAWQLSQLEDEKGRWHKDYWLKQFSGELPVLELPINHIRPSVKTYNGNRVTGVFSKSVSSQLKQIIKKENGTAFMGLLSLVKALLYRYTGQGDIIVGSPIAGREHEDLVNQIGFYVNTLALRTQFDGADSFRELLQKVKETTLSAYKHQIYPFDELVDRLNLSRNLSRSPLFDVMVVLQNNERGSKDEHLGELQISSYEASEWLTSKFDLTFTFVETDQELHYSINYNTDLFEKATIKRFNKHLKQLTESIIASPEKSINKLDYLSEKEAHQLLVDFNDAEVYYPEDKTIVHLFEEQVAKTPNNIAVVFEEKEFTYQDINECANQLGDYLRSNYKIETDDLVAIKLDRSEWLLIAILGVLKSGGAYMPIDPEYPQERISFMLSDSQPKVVIDEKELDKFKKAQEGYTKENLSISASSKDLVYVMYTSGSTGQPKGIQIEHKSIVRLVKWGDMLNLSPKDVLYSVSSPSFDAVTFDYWVILSNGGKLLLSQKEAFLDPAFMVEEIKKHKVTTMFMTTALTNSLIDVDITAFKDLKTLLTGGENYSHQRISKLKATYLDLKILHVYGPTENTTFSTYFDLKDPEFKVFPIGQSITNTNTYVLDSNSNILPIGVIGEICLSGDGLARGYLNRPELTAEKFVQNPFKEGERMYKTGDLGRWLPDGNIEFIGRKDDQVKIRGYRIELGEIENILQQHPLIEQTVVLVKEDANQEKQLVAYLTSEEELTIADLKTYLKKRLPNYMFPSHFVALEVFPLTHNGKVDKKALPSPEGLGLASGVEYLAPSNEIEKELVKIWSEVLKVEEERIGIKDDFFDFGGHSLRATKLASKIYQRLEVTIPLKNLFENTSIEEQALFISKEEKTRYYQIEKVREQESYALSSAQRRLWVLSQFEGGNLAYNIPGVFELEGDLDIPSFQKSFDTLIERHEILRTVFKKDESGEIRQWIKTAEEQVFEIDYQDLRKNKDQKTRIKTLVKTETETETAFDLEQGPLLRAQLLQTAKGKYTFIYVMHHIISDGWSMGVMIKELLTLYNSYSEGKDNPLESLTIQYKDYSAWQLGQLEDEKGQGHKAYWLNQFSGELPVLELPTDHIRPVLKTYNGNTINTLLSKEKIEKLKAIIQAEGSTLYMGILSVVKTLLYRYTNQEDIIVGTHIAGREHADLSDQIGFYINTLALRNQINGEESFRALLKRVKQTTLDAYEHQSYPFDALIENLDLKKDISRSPLFDIWVVLQNLDSQADESLNLGSLKVSTYEDREQATSQFDLSLIFSDSEEGLNLALKYNTDLFEKETIERFQTHLDQLLGAIVNNPDQALKTIDYLSKAEEQQLLIDFNDTKVAYPKGKTIVDLFEEQVQKTPNNIALVFEEKEFSYQELDRLSNQLAHCLLTEYKIQPEEIVGIQLERSHWFIISILGILKAGGAYLPIDTEYPASRKEFLLKDSNTQLLITSTNYIFDLDFYEGNIFSIDVEFEANNYSTESVKTKQSSSNLAYVIYTSGSTGKPKGVMIEHKAILNTINFFTEESDFEQNERGLLFASFSFDASISDTFLILLNGGQLYLLNNQERIDAHFVSDFIVKNKINHSLLPPSFIKKMDINKLRNLKTLFTGGEKADVDQFNQLDNIVNAYGPTEVSICSTTFSSKNNSIYENTIPIGTPIANIQIYILSEGDALLPIGMIGEICIAGAGLARGYLNRPELTAEKFVANPFVEGTKMYKTGDLGRWLPDGNIEFVGRKDDQVKIRGYRIELGEIENVLQQHPAIEHTVVLVKEDANGEQQLVAYLTSKEELTTSGLRAYLKKSLPDYMLPAHFVSLESFPLTPNGKVDKKGLPSPEGLGLASGVEYVAPRNEIEEELVNIWSEVLRVEKEKIGVKDDFFELGGHSLRATIVIGKIHSFSGVSISLKEIFHDSNIEYLSKKIIELQILKTNEEKFRTLSENEEEFEL